LARRSRADQIADVVPGTKAKSDRKSEQDSADGDPGNGHEKGDVNANLIKADDRRNDEDRTLGHMSQ
jgi:hypothetical protein